MTSQFLYLTNTRMVSLTASGGRLVARREFAVSGAGMEDFERHLRGMTDVPAHIIGYRGEEDFLLDTVPHGGAQDHDQIIARKLGQIFRGTPHKYAIQRGR